MTTLSHYQNAARSHLKQRDAAEDVKEDMAENVKAF